MRVRSAIDPKLHRRLDSEGAYGMRSFPRRRAARAVAARRRLETYASAVMSPIRVLVDAFRVYRLLFRRSVATAALIYGAIALLEELEHIPSSRAFDVLVSVTSFVTTWGGPVLVQGALVRIVRNVHQGQRPETVPELLARAGRRFLSLLGASIVYGIGVTFGLIALILPGLLVASRWSLMAPVIMLEGDETFDALGRSRAIVRGNLDAGAGDRTWSTLVVVGTSYIVGGLALLVFWAVYGRSLPITWYIVITNGYSAIGAPYFAHVLSVLYYRLTEPAAPIIAPSVAQWKSVWLGPSE
jgi:hypothetical protein